MGLKLLNDNDVHNITSGQVIIELKSVIKELLENSLDASSTSIQITFKRFGLEGIEIVDNGDGIDEKDFENLCSKNYTSKLKNFDDLNSVKTLGFRGEALNSICNVCSLTISTTTSSMAPKGWEITYDENGNLVNKKLVNQSKGTTVKISDIFNNLPVRKLNLEKNYKKEFQHCISMLTSYVVFLTNCRILVNNIDITGKKKVILKTSGNKNIKDNIVNVFGSSGLLGLVEFSENFAVDNESEIRISGLVSKASIGDGRLTKDRQFIYINNRPVLFKRVTKLLNDVYKRFNSLQKPVFVLNISLDEFMIDVNVTPDKSIVLLSSKYENILIDQLESVLENFWDNGGTHYIPVDAAVSDNLFSQRNSGMRQVTLESFAFTQDSSDINIDIREDYEMYDDSKKQKEENEGKEEEDKDETTQNIESLIVNNDNIVDNLNNGQNINVSSSFMDNSCCGKIDIKGQLLDTTSDFIQKEERVAAYSINIEAADSKISFEEEEQSCKNISAKLLFVPSDEEIILPDKTWSSNQVDISSMIRIESCKVRITENDLKPASYGKQQFLTKECINNIKKSDLLDKELSEKLLGLSIHKNDFTNMRIVGQFNKGFVIVFKKDSDDILIVDQHASDEKYNFERLIEETTFESQPLVVPQKLDLSLIEKLTIMSNKEKFIKSGFKFKNNTATNLANDELDTDDVYLASLPYSKDTIFTIDDLNELIQLVKDNGHSATSLPRPSKVRAMFAMRACRSSIMIGQVLSDLKMQEIVKNLSTLDKPWNCPHGRPTMRHLVNIDKWNSFSSDYQL